MGFKTSQIAQLIKLSSFLIVLLIVCPVNIFAQDKTSKKVAEERVVALLEDFDKIYTIEPTRAKGLVQQALNTSIKFNLNSPTAESHYRIGKLHLNVGEYDSAFQNINKALKIFSEINDYEKISLCYKELGIIYNETGRREESMKSYRKGLSLAKKHNLDNLIAPFINNIGIIYLNQSHYEKALEHFEESAELSKKGYQYAITLNNIGVANYKQGKDKEAIKYYEKSLEACNAIEDEYCSLTPLNGIANTALRQKSYQKAIETTLKAIKIQNKLGLEKDLLVSHNRMGLIYNAMAEYELAIHEYERSLEISEKINSVHTSYIHANISDCYRNIGDFEKALTHKEIFYQKQDSINAKEYKIKTEELLTQYETDKKENEIALLKKDKALQEIEVEKNRAYYEQELLNKNLEEQENRYELLERDRKIDLLNKDSEIQKANIENQQNELERQALIRNIIIVSAVLIFIPIIILLIVYRQKVRNKELLAQKIEEVNQQKTLEMIRSFEIKTIRAHIEGQEIEKHRIAKELHDGVAGSLAAIKMRLQGLGTEYEGKPKFDNLLSSVDNVYKEVRTISHHLTPPGMLKYSFVDFLKKYLNEISQADYFEIEYIFHGETELNEMTDEIKVEIYRMLQELVTNAIKHANTDFLEIQLIKDGTHINLIVEDRGKGFNFSEKSTGLGLSNLQQRIKTLGGQLHVDSFKGRGSIINIEIELNKPQLQYS